MRHLAILLLLLCPGLAVAGTKAGAELVVKEYDTATQRWALQLRAAVDPEAQLRVWKNRPEPNEFGERVWTEIRAELRNEWTLPFAAWLIETAPIYAAEAYDPRAKRTPAQSIMHALDRFHTKSKGAGRLCLSLTYLPDPKTLKLVEKVAKVNPDEEAQGQAAMSIAMLLKGLGDAPDIMKRRLTRLREAIVKAAHVKVGDVTVAALAEDEIFVITNLAKGRTAPDIIGRDAAGEIFKLSLVKSKVTVLAFWHSNMLDAERGIGLLSNLHKTCKDRGMELIGVTTEQEEVLRHLKSNGTIPWRNFSDATGRITKEYRVQRLPVVYVLDKEKKIHFIGTPGAFVDLAVEALLADG